MNATKRRRGPTRRFSDEEVNYIVEAYRQGESTVKIGEFLSCGASAVTRCLSTRGIPLRPSGFRKREEHHAWTGGVHIREDGYVRIWLHADHPFLSMAQRHGDTDGGYVLEHRLVMATSLGRVLRRDETVHHIDGDRQNNELSNLQLRQGRHGKNSGLCCGDCGSSNLIPVPILEKN